jgi:hypothetical protein
MAPITQRSSTVPRPASLHNSDAANAASLIIGALALVSGAPGALIGAVVTAVARRSLAPRLLFLWAATALGVAAAALLHDALSFGWPWRAVSHILGNGEPVPIGTVAVALPVGALLGPLVYCLLESAGHLRHLTISGQDRARYKAALATRRMLVTSSAPRRRWREKEAAVLAHPQGATRLGRGEDGQILDITDHQLSSHIVVLGGTGSGKSTTLALIADGKLAAGAAVVIVDCKGGGLRRVSRTLAARYDAPFAVVDPNDDSSLGYDPCSGEPAEVANKLLGAFTYSPEAQIYKNIAMEAIPPLCDAMRRAGVTITLDAIRDSFADGAISRRGRQAGRKEPDDDLDEEFHRLAERGRLAKEGYEGLQARLGALRNGKFGPIFRRRPALDWREATTGRRVTYLGLPTTAAAEDVELFARVICQDLKQLCYRRLARIDRGEQVTPVLVAFDEFAALREAEQIRDLLLQGREAGISVLAAPQYLPLDADLRRSLLSAGVLIVHYLASEDAKAVAEEFNTATTQELTTRIDYRTGDADEGSARQVEEYVVHPNTIRSLPTGIAAVRVRNPHLVVQVQVFKPL